LKKVLIDHCDLDGLGVIVLVKYYNIEFDEIYNINYDEYSEYDHVIDSLTKDDTIVFTDFSPSKEWIIKIDAIGCTTEILDHHGHYEDIESSCYLCTEWAKVNSNVTYYYSPNEKSGTELFYDHYITDKSNKVVEKFVQLVSIYDTAKKNNPLFEQAKDLNRLFYKTKCWGKQGLEQYKYFIENCMYYKFNNPQYGFKFNRLEETKIAEDKKRELEIFNKLVSGGKETIKTRKDDHDNYFCVIRLKSKASGISEMLLTKYAKLQYIIIINEFNSDRLLLSLRSRESFDLRQLENVKGHAQAAGVENCDSQLCEDLWTKKVYSLKYKEN